MYLLSRTGFLVQGDICSCCALVWFETIAVESYRERTVRLTHFCYAVADTDTPTNQNLVSHRSCIGKSTFVGDIQSQFIARAGSCELPVAAVLTYHKCLCLFRYIGLSGRCVDSHSFCDGGQVRGVKLTTYCTGSFVHKDNRVTDTQAAGRLDTLVWSGRRYLSVSAHNNRHINNLLFTHFPILIAVCVEMNLCRIRSGFGSVIMHHELVWVTYRVPWVGSIQVIRTCPKSAILRGLIGRFRPNAAIFLQAAPAYSHSNGIFYFR